MCGNTGALVRKRPTLLSLLTRRRPCSAGCTEAYALDEVSGPHITAPRTLQVGETWLAPHFEFHGDRSVHFGAPACSGPSPLSSQENAVRASPFIPSVHDTWFLRPWRLARRAFQLQDRLWRWGRGDGKSLVLLSVRMRRQRHV